MKLKYKMPSFFFLIFMIWLIIIQFQTYKYPDKEEIDKRLRVCLNFMERIINEPLDSGSEIMLLRNESHEFMPFSLTITKWIKD